MLINQIAVVLDRSGSMTPHRYRVVRAFNEQLNVIRERSRAEGQRTYVSLYTFSNCADPATFFDVAADTVQPLSERDYRPNGQTALYDAIAKAASELDNVRDYFDTSFLVVVLTDGEENNSHLYDQESIQRLMQKKIATDRWTFVFVCPQTSIHTLIAMGVPEGNIQPWDGSEEDFERSSQAYSVGLNSYFVGRSAGRCSTKTFFRTDMSIVDVGQLKAKLFDVRQNFKKIAVEREIAIAPFIEEKMHNPYVRGSVFYQLTKKEDVQEYKEIVLEDRKTSAIYSGAEVRPLLGMPQWGTTRVEPGNHMDWNIYVQSTSLNRKLVRGTSVLVRK